jgi:hypothetical protein
MKYPLFLVAAFAGSFALLSCGPSTTGGSTNASSDPRAFPFGDFESNVPIAPKLAGYRQVPSRSTAMRDATIDHPDGRWTYSYDVHAERLPILITTASGKSHRVAGEFYPEEGGADAAGVYAFVKGSETIVVLQGTSAMTYEETHVTFQGETLVRARKYAVKGGGMGEGAPGVAPKFPVYPPN